MSRNSGRVSGGTAAQLEPPVDNRLAVRLEEDLARRLLKVVAASKRTKTSIVEECIEESLDRLERHYKAT